MRDKWEAVVALSAEDMQALVVEHYVGLDT